MQRGSFLYGVPVGYSSDRIAEVVVCIEQRVDSFRNSIPGKTAPCEGLRELCARLTSGEIFVSPAEFLGSLTCRKLLQRPLLRFPLREAFA